MLVSELERDVGLTKTDPLYTPCNRERIYQELAAAFLSFENVSKCECVSVCVLYHFLLVLLQTSSCTVWYKKLDSVTWLFIQNPL